MPNRREGTQVATGDSYEREHALAVDVARRAGATILRHYQEETVTARTKQDGSPVTEADLAADRLIRAAVAGMFPDDALLTEESGDDPRRPHNRRCWIVDPLDGTAQFVRRTGDFDVFIALVVDGRPVVAATAHPPTGVVLSGVAGGGAWSWPPNGAREPSRVTLPSHSNPPTVVSSTWYRGVETAPALARIAATVGASPPPVVETGFTPRKLLREPRHYDAFVGLAPHWSHLSAREWDIATADLLVNEAGGRFSDLRGNLHRYNKPAPYVDGGLLISADPALHDRLLAAIRDEG